MKILIVFVAFCFLAVPRPGFSQLSRYCETQPRMDPREKEAQFQLPFEIADGFKTLKGQPDPFFAHFTVLPTYVLLQRLLKIGVGPEILWSDVAPRFGATARASIDVMNYNVTPFNNIPLSSTLLTLGVNVGWHAKPIYTVGFSIELMREMTTGLTYSRFEEGNQGGVLGFLAYNPLHTPSEEPTPEIVAPTNLTDEDKYYLAFTTSARSIFGNPSDSIRIASKKNDAGWNSIADIAALRNFLRSVVHINVEALVPEIIKRARAQQKLENITVASESESMVVAAILKGFCEQVR